MQQRPLLMAVLSHRRVILTHEPARRFSGLREAEMKGKEGARDWMQNKRPRLL